MANRVAVERLEAHRLYSRASEHFNDRNCVRKQYLDASLAVAFDWLAIISGVKNVVDRINDHREFC